MERLLRFPQLSPAEQQAILDSPAMAPPPRVETNLVDPPNHNALATAFSVVCITLVVVCLLGRATPLCPLGARNKLFWAICTVMAFNISLYSVAMVAETMTCIPLNKLWTPWLSGRCFDSKSLHVVTAWFNLLVDVFILLLPQHIIWKLQMTTRKKMGVSVIFLFGLLTLMGAAGRVWANLKTPYVKDHGDTLYWLGPLFLWLMTESTCALLVYSIPLLPKACHQIIVSIKSWRRLGSNDNCGLKTPAADKGPSDNGGAVHYDSGGTM
ncbi:hypothetical protein HIM_09807 [Hirsutella minnesotensis 3608]|uniref:Rhodopsin domain-containing protein n=1 Tax=Hirsutella minnesotensis 3608 TaxID=1043627 RepID=A0A0F8A2W6_9HYPO|nr:hypothetical protein HIM_09807 [Hirsutella minnesotensis 3608]